MIRSAYDLPPVGGVSKRRSKRIAMRSSRMAAKKYGSGSLAATGAYHGQYGGMDWLRN
eukprot:COSAG05_NODE_1359_length_5097_cov_2.531813_4_plen_58_part_00